MYFTRISHYRNNCFACLVENKTLENSEAILYSKIVGQYRIVIFQNPVEEDSLLRWFENLGYYSDFKMPTRDYSEYDTSLTFYPDNEEMLVIYNSSDQETTVDIINTRQLPKNINHWNVWDKYDDIWFTCENKDYNEKLAKSIVQSKNFNTSHHNKYKPVRKNRHHHLKLFPRHPMNTDAMFCPKKDVIELLRFNKYKFENHGELVEGITQHPYTDDYIKSFKIKPKTFIMIDQLMTQWRTNQINELSLYPLWYKTEVRKHFNYSI